MNACRSLASVPRRCDKKKVAVSLRLSRPKRVTVGTHTRTHIHTHIHTHRHTRTALHYTWSFIISLSVFPGVSLRFVTFGCVSHLFSFTSHLFLFSLFCVIFDLLVLFLYLPSLFLV